jgi:uncharacterized damage-inducible protein DinB
MISPHAAQELIAYHYAAYDKLWTIVAAITPEQFTQNTGYSLGSVQSQLIHVLGVDARWFARIAGTPLPAFQTPAEIPTITALHAAWMTNAAAIKAQTAALTDADLARVISFDMPHRGGMKNNAIWHIISHVVNHGTDHRAQILATLHTVGAPTMEQDMMFYYWGLF